MRVLRRYKSTIHGPYARKSLTYGLIMGGIMSLILVIRWMMLYPINSPVSWVENITMLVVMFACVYHYRKNCVEGGKMTFKEAYLLGLYSAVVASIIYGIFICIYASVIDTALSERMFEVMRKAEQYNGYSDESVRSMAKVSYFAVYSIMLNVVMSVLWSLVCGIILRNEKGERI